DLPDVLYDGTELLQILRAMPVVADALHKIFSADALPLGFRVAYEIDVRHDRLIRRRKAPREILQQKPRPAVLVRLEHANQPLRMITLAQRLKRRADLGRMMAIVVHDARAVVLAHEGHPAIAAGVAFNGFNG